MKMLLVSLSFLLSTVALTAQSYYGRTYDNQPDDWLLAVASTTDGGTIAVGRTAPQSRSFQPWIVRLDAQGDTLWTRELVVDPSRLILLMDVQETADSGFIACGTEYYVKLNSQGQIEWDYQAPSASTDEVVHYRAVRQTADGGYLIVGDSTPISFSHYPRILCLDARGNRRWQRDYGSTGNLVFNDLQVLPSGDFVVVGGEIFAPRMGIIQQHDPQGTVTWTQLWSDNIKAIIPAADSGYWFLHGSGHLGKISPRGDSLLDWPLDTNHYAKMALAPDGSLLLVGNNLKVAPIRAILSNFTTTGVLSWQQTFAQPGGNIHLHDLVQHPNGNLSIVGLFSSNIAFPNNNNNGYWASVGPRGQYLSMLPLSSSIAISAFPNPTASTLIIERPHQYSTTALTAVLMDLQGRSWAAFPLTTSMTTVSVASLPLGVYFLCIKNTQGTVLTTQKIVKQ